MTSIPIYAWVPGNQLRAADKAHALRIFTHRSKDLTDHEWLSGTLFAIRRDGGLDQRVKKYRTPGSFR
jgi:hypothetical protein